MTGYGALFAGMLPGRRVIILARATLGCDSSVNRILVCTCGDLCWMVVVKKTAERVRHSKNGPAEAPGQKIKYAQHSLTSISPGPVNPVRLGPLHTPRQGCMINLSPVAFGANFRTRVVAGSGLPNGRSDYGVLPSFIRARGRAPLASTARARRRSPPGTGAAGRATDHEPPSAESA
jgi:hypothetical protein